MSSVLPAEAADASSKKKDKKEKTEKRHRSEKKEKIHKGDHDDPERSSKKRKRDHAVEEPQQTQTEPVTAVAPPDTPSDEVLRKKRKKEKHDKKQKKDKSKHDSPVDVEVQPAITAAQTKPNAEKLISHTPFYKRTTSFYLPLSPAAHAFPVAGLCAEHLSPLLLTYYPPLRGVLLSYSNVRLSEHQPTDANTLPSITENETKSQSVLAKSIHEYAPSFLWLTADFLLFQPSRGKWMEGCINLQNESLIGMVCYNYFNAVIERENLPEGWRWVDDATDPDEYGRDGETALVAADATGDGVVARKISKKGKKRRGGDGVGWFVDSEGRRVEGKVVFRVVDFEATEGNSSDGGVVGTVSIVGSLREEG